MDGQELSRRTGGAGPASGLTDRIAARLRALDYDGLVELYRPDALVDASLPQWRFQLQGREATRRSFREDAGRVTGGARVSEWRVTPTDDGVVVELELGFSESGEERRRREVHLFHTDGTAITEHVNYRTGTWDADTIARQAVEAPMVHRCAEGKSRRGATP